MTSTDTFFIVTNFWGSSKPSTKSVAGLAAAVEQFNATRQRKGVRRVSVATDPNLNTGLILDNGSI